MKKLLLSFCIVIPIATVFPLRIVTAQPIQFHHGYGGLQTDDPRSVVQTADGGYLLSGFTQSFGVQVTCMYLVKTDASGIVQWDKAYGDSLGLVDASEAIELSDGNILIAGTRYISGSFAQTLWKTDASGNVLWEKNFDFNSIGSALGFSVVESSSGDYVISGYNFQSSTKYNFLLAKTDAAGTIAWTYSIGGTDNEQAFNMIETADGGYAIIGSNSTTANPGDPRTFIVKTNSSGTIQWHALFDHPDHPSGYDIVQTSDGGYVLLANSTFANDYYTCLIKIDSIANIVWSKSFSITGSDIYGAQLKVNSSDELYVAGTSTASFNKDVLAFKTDASGNVLWARTYSGSLNDYGDGITLTADTGIAIFGGTESFKAALTGGAIYDLYLIKADDNGISGCYENTVLLNSASLPLSVIPYTVTSASDTTNLNAAPLTVYTGGIDSVICPLTGLAELSDDNLQFTFNPNPADQSLVISHGSFAYGVMKIFNVVGEEIYSVHLQPSNHKLQTSNFPDGIYFVQLSSENKTVTQKLIVQH